MIRRQRFDDPISDFRETQTAFGVRSILRNGMSIFHADIPVFGPPWKVPFEFPLFQYFSALVARFLGYGEVEASLLTATILFLASGVAFFVLVKIISGRATARIGLVIFLFSAYGLHFGTRVLIEFTAVLFGLIAMISILKFFKSSRFLFLFLFFISSSLVFLVKITTAVPWILVGTSLAILTSKKPLKIISLCFAISFVSTCIGLLWTQYADSVKNQNPHTKWLTSKNLRDFNFGTIQQRIDPEFWRIQFSDIFETSIGSIALGFVFISIAIVKAESRVFVLIFLAIFLSGPIAFSNLYMHEYYLNAVFPALIYVFALAIDVIWSRIKFVRSPIIKLYLSCLTTFGLTFLSTVTFPGRDLMKNFDSTEFVSEYPILNEVRERTNPDDNVILIGRDWSPSYLFLIDRRGLMLLPDGVRPDKSELGTVYKFVYWVDIETTPTVDEWRSYFPTGINFERIRDNFFRIRPVGVAG